MAEHRTLEITLQYARDVKKVNLFSKMDVYAVVSIAGGDKKAGQKIKTPVDHDGNDNPTWNFPMKFNVEEAALQSNRLTLKIKLVCERALGDKDVGEVSVPLKELLDSPVKGGESAAEGRKFVNYQVRKPSGKPKGQLAFSYQFGEKVVSAPVAQPYVSAPAPPYPPPTHGKADSEPQMAYPAGPSSGYPPPAAGAYPPPAGYPAPAAAAAGYGYPPPPPPQGYGYPPPPPQGYGYAAQPGYGYPPPPVAQQQPPKKNKFGMGLGAGLLGGAIGGLLIGDMIDGGGCGGGCGGGGCGGF